MADNRINYIVGRKVEAYDVQGNLISGPIYSIGENGAAEIMNEEGDIVIVPTRTKQIGENPSKDIAAVFD